MSSLILNDNFSLFPFELVFQFHHSDPIFVRELHLLDPSGCFILLLYVEYLPLLSFFSSHQRYVVLLFLSALERLGDELFVDLHLLSLVSDILEVAYL